MMLELMGGKLAWAPLSSNPGRVLDLGTGTGICMRRLKIKVVQGLTIPGAIDFADQYPSAEVIGNDLSPIQPSWVPDNLKFYIDDIEDDWAYQGNLFDYVHARYLAGAIRDWPALLKQAYRNTRPGGWAEFQEWDYRIQSSDNTLPPDSSLQTYHDHVDGRLESAGLDASPGAGLEKWFKDAGFVNVQAHCLPIPLGMWPKDKRMVGKLPRRCRNC